LRQEESRWKRLVTAIGRVMSSPVED
jgi:hypothetical protein